MNHRSSSQPSLLSQEILTHATEEIPVPVAARPGYEPRRWAVVGGTGFIGAELTKFLTLQGHHVTTVHAPRVTLDPPNVNGTSVARIASAHHEVDSLAEQLAAVDLVINAAGMAAPDSPVTPALFGANALLPVIIAHAASRARVPRVLHLSSAAVQGNRPTLDETTRYRPFSPYSHSKALGERALIACRSSWQRGESYPDLIILRATSVQGAGRRTTRQLRKVARSPLATVAAPRNRPTIVSSVSGLVRFTHLVGRHTGPLPAILLQPWEGLSTSEVLFYAGGRQPLELPAWLCRMLTLSAKGAGLVSPKIAGMARRIELMWFGQDQTSSQLDLSSLESRSELIGTLRGERGDDR